MVLDLGAGERRQVAGGDIGPPLVRPAVRIAEVAVGQPQPLGIFVHHIGEGFLGAGNAFGEDDRGVVAGQGDDPVQQVLDADLLAGRKEHGRTRLRAMPFLPGLRPHRAHLVEAEVALLDQLEGDIGRHHLRHRCRRHPAIGVLGKQNCARGQVDQVGDLRRRLERRRLGGGSGG